MNRQLLRQPSAPIGRRTPDVAPDADAVTFAELLTAYTAVREHLVRQPRGGAR